MAAPFEVAGAQRTGSDQGAPEHRRSGTPCLHQTASRRSAQRKPRSLYRLCNGSCHPPSMLCTMPTIDRLDAALVGELAREPRVSIVELARRLGVARGTA